MSTSVGFLAATWRRCCQLLPCLLVATALLATQTVARATDQALDSVRFEGKVQYMTVCPLNYLPFGGPEDLDLDFDTTANWKCYLASWEIKDRALFLVSFAAKQNKKDVPLEAILPGRKYPVLADWFTGRIRIPIDEPIEDGPGGYYGARFARIVILHIEKGKVLKTEELKNSRLRTWSDEKEEQRSKYKIWPFPKLEARTVEALSGSLYDKAYFIHVSPATIRSTPAWSKDATDPPLSPLRAMNRADAKSRELARGAKFNWDLDKAEIIALPDDRYYYQFTYHADSPKAVSRKYPPSLTLLVLMDGTVPEPLTSDKAGVMHAIRAGAFNVEKRKVNEPPERPYPQHGAILHELSWQFRLELLGKILAAPKLFYEVEKLEVYPNGVWAEYSITNSSNKRKYFSPEFLHFPVGGMGLWDSKGTKWMVPSSYEDLGYRNPPEFFVITAGQTVRYRELLSDDKELPLKPTIRDPDRQPSRPKALEYFIAQWPTAFTHLNSERDSEVKMFAFGYGRVPVTWFDKNYPDSWPRQEVLRK